MVCHFLVGDIKTAFWPAFNLVTVSGNKLRNSRLTKKTVRSALAVETIVLLPKGRQNRKTK